MRPPGLAPEGLVNVRVAVDESRQKQDAATGDLGSVPLRWTLANRRDQTIAHENVRRVGSERSHVEQQQIVHAHAVSVQRCGYGLGYCAARGRSAVWTGRPSVPARRIASTSSQAPTKRSRSSASNCVPRPASIVSRASSGR